MSISNFMLLVIIISGTKPNKCIPKKLKNDFKDAKNLFDDFLQKFNKSYNTMKEYKFRFKTFRGNLREVNSKNRQRTSVKFGISKFMDLTREERTKRLVGLKIVNKLKQTHSKSVFKQIYPEDVPDEWDWRRTGVVTPVQDQGDCLACWTFSTVGTIEDQYALLYKKSIPLSAQQLLDCTGKHNSCGGGLPCTAVKVAMKYNGVASAADYPYIGRVDMCHANNKNKVANIINLFTYYYDTLNEDDLKSLVYSHGPIVVGMQAGVSFLSYASGIATPEHFECYPEREMAHAVLIVGYGIENEMLYWRAKNSYGTLWGEAGYFRIERGVNACNFTTYILGVHVAGPTEAPSTDSPPAEAAPTETLCTKRYEIYSSDSPGNSCD